MADRVITTHITSVEFVSTSRNGNPSYRVFITDDPYVLRTEIDGAVNYSINNSDMHEGAVSLHINEYGRIVYAVPEQA